MLQIIYGNALQHMSTIYNKYRKYYHTQTQIIVHYYPGILKVHWSVSISNHIALISFMILHISDYFNWH